MADFDYWTPHNLLTHNAIFNMAIGGRGTGKTFGSLYYWIKHYLRTGHIFVYLRRYETNLEKKEKLLTAVGQKFPTHEFTVEGQKLCIRPVAKPGEENEKRPWRIMGYAMPLSKATSDKSIPYDDCDGIIFDEFLIGKTNERYLKNEVELFIDFYNTVDRYNDRVRVFFLANAVALVNPYFIYYGISPRKGQKIKKYKDGYIALEMVKSKGFAEKVEQTRFGRMIKDTAYYDYAVENEFRDNDENFIAQKTPSAQFHSAYSFDGEVIALWSDVEGGCYFVTQKVPKDKQTFALTKADMQPNILMIDRSSRLLKGVMRLYMQGSVFFDNVQSRAVFYSILDYLNLR